MIVIRYTWHIDASHIEEARTLFTDFDWPESGILRGVRGYQARTGMTNTLVAEWEFESLADWEAFLGTFVALPGNLEKFRRWDKLAPAATCEVWDLIAAEKYEN